jgi:hypothetical protein
VTTNRRCGDCQLCCKLLPTPEIGSLANERCKHQKHGVGCAIYARRPLSCQLWSCGWLQPDDHDTHDLPRPDRAHYVVDPMPDFITMTWSDGSPPEHIPVVQVWVDPDHKDAHRAPSFRAWLDRQGIPAIVRFNERDGFVLFPPSTNAQHVWREEHSSTREHSHTLEQKAAALGASLEVTLTPEGDGAIWRTMLTVGGKQYAVAAQAASAEQATEAWRSIGEMRKDARRAARRLP